MTKAVEKIHGYLERERKRERERERERSATFCLISGLFKILVNLTFLINSHKSLRKFSFISALHQSSQSRFTIFPFPTFGLFIPQLTSICFVETSLWKIEHSKWMKWNTNTTT